MIHPPSNTSAPLEHQADPHAEADRFREAMSRIAGAVHLITTDGVAGKAGLTATAFTSVSAEPPTLLVCLSASSRTAAILRENGRFAVNTLGAGHQHLADVFAGRTPAKGLARFEHGVWQAGPDEQPVLSDALIVFSAHVQEIKPVATHLIVIGAITHIELGHAHAGLVYTRRAFHAL